MNQYNNRRNPEPCPVRSLYETTGAIHVRLRVANTKPSGYKSCMPDHLREWLDVIEVTADSIKVHHAYQDTGWSPPTAKEITEHDRMQGYILSLGVYCQDKGIPWVSRAVAKSWPHHPMTGRPLISGRKLAKKLQCNYETLRRWKEDGLDIIRQKFFF